MSPTPESEEICDTVVVDAEAPDVREAVSLSSTSNEDILLTLF